MEGRESPIIEQRDSSNEKNELRQRCHALDWQNFIKRSANAAKADGIGSASSKIVELLSKENKQTEAISDDDLEKRNPKTLLFDTPENIAEDAACLKTFFESNGAEIRIAPRYLKMFPELAGLENLASAVTEQKDHDVVEEIRKLNFEIHDLLRLAKDNYHLSDAIVTSLKNEHDQMGLKQVVKEMIYLLGDKKKLHRKNVQELKDFRDRLKALNAPKK